MDILDKFGLHFFGWVFPWFCAGGAGWLWVAWKRGNASVTWPSTPGTILESVVENEDGSYIPKITFCYWVEEQRYEGDTFTYRGYYANRATAEAYAARFPAGARVLVFYNPESPEVSVLEPGVDRAVYLRAIVVLLILFAIGIGFKIAALFG